MLTGGATYEKYDKRAIARKHHSTRGQPNKLEGDEGASRIHVKASRGLGKELHGRSKKKETFEKFHDCWSEYMSLSEAAIFEYAFKLGMNIAIETLKNNNDEQG